MLKRFSEDVDTGIPGLLKAAVPLSFDTTSYFEIGELNITSIFCILFLISINQDLTGDCWRSIVFMIWGFLLWRFLMELQVIFKQWRIKIYKDFLNLEIVALGERGLVGMGLVPPDFPFGNQPGLMPGSIGYHSANGGYSCHICCHDKW